MKDFSQIARTAIKMEHDGIEFYKKAADKTVHPLGKEMFLSFAKDEKRHLNVLNEILTNLIFSSSEEYFKETPRKKIETAFSKVKDEINERIFASPDEMEVLKIGMEMENESIRFYEDAFKKTTNSKAKALLEKLIPEEKDHYRILDNTHSFLEDSGKWFLWEERAMLDGG